MAREGERRPRGRRESRELSDRPLASDVDGWVVPDEDRIRQAHPPAPVGDVLAGLVDRAGWGQRLRGVSIFDRWEELVGGQLASKCEPVRLAGGRLVVRVESQAWATQVRYLTGRIRERAAQILPDGSVDAIEIVIGPLTGTTDRAE